MHFISEQRLDDGVLAREFTLGEIPGTLWTPESDVPVPLILMAHNNGLPKREPRLVARARHSAAHGHAVATIDAAGCGDRPRSAADEQARADIRRAMQAGEPVDEIFESFIGPLVEKAAPEWRTTLDALLSLPGIGGPVGYSGWMALGIRLAAADPRIAAAGFFAGGYVPRAQREEARQVTVPLLLLLQWDDEGNPRQRALDLFDAFGTEEKTLHANTGGHTGTPWFEVEDGDRFFGRHLK
ncbi:alpha/beta hydrolase [Streptomyces sp. NE06-03E]|uniref:alpha/beta hydrolase n=1 Tax=unclassified Streptomyces TaxID=2593676 RepID=UPI000F551839|nr:MULTISPECIES: alpha/beta hydrolase [unclassified Streptomyces]MDX3056781.1 alpha/beta hydrolase [Streptomyces sp. NE06-03E]RPK35598.1 Alpha/beta hydrolase family protein [Streptomyces sp. ADI93-02]WSS79804.1 alpha/beta hydrolase [Streptomyces sp. NBC_01174]